MATTGFILPSANNDDDGTYGAFTNPGNAQTDDTNFTNPTGGSGGAWFWKTFDFAGAGLGASDTVTGINIQVRGSDAYGDGGWAIEAGHKSDADTVVDNYTLQRWPGAGDWPGAGSGTPSTHSVALTDVPTATEALSADFRLAILINVGLHGSDAELEAIWLEIVYTPSGGGVTSLQAKNYQGIGGSLSGGFRE